MDSANLAWLLEHIARNRFLPTPPLEAVYVGDGDFRAIGIEFLRYCIELGGLRPDARVVDFGCGQGRMAVPLTQYLRPDGAYEGIDIVPAAIAWCRQAITPVYENFRFTALDVCNPIYNPAGSVQGPEVVLPLETASFDFALAISVFTHLGLAETTHYAAELARVLKPGGRLLATFFLMDGDAAGMIRAGAADPRLAFPPDAASAELQGIPDAPAAAVALNAEAMLGGFRERGLSLVGEVQPGHWCGRPGRPNYQDLCVFEKTG